MKVPRLCFRVLARIRWTARADEARSVEGRAGMTHLERQRTAGVTRSHFMWERQHALPVVRRARVRAAADGWSVMKFPLSV